MELSPVGSSNFGPFLPNEQILAFSIGTNSAAAINSIEFAINKFGLDVVIKDTLSVYKETLSHDYK
jgi:hypothetical protein